MTRSLPARITLEPLDLDEHLGPLHGWVTHPRSVFWQMQDATVADVHAEYARIAADPHHHAWLGRADGVPAFLAETYDPAHSELAALPEVGGLADGDLGMHVLVAPTDRPVRGFTRAVMGAVLRHCFADPAVRRVVVEPDVRNEKIAALNAAAGFEVARVVPLSTKQAALSFCTREAFLASSLAEPSPVHPPVVEPVETRRVEERSTSRPTPQLTADHLRPDLLDRAERHLVAKAIAEFSHERLLVPEPDGAGAWRLSVPDRRTTYRFAARRTALDHWIVDEPSLTRTRGGEQAPLDAQAFVVEFAERLGIPEQLLATYLEELAATLASSMWKLAHRDAPVSELVDAGYQDVEGAMTEGHPAFVANNGRIGFGLDDYTAYAPETGADVRLVWLAARRAHTRLSLGEGLTEQTLYAEELDAEVRERFAGVLAGLGLDPADYLYLPVHPWQWTNKVAVTFAPDLARRDLVHLGAGPDDYRPQQSIRTFFNTSRPDRHYVKTALAIQNMGFLRGLSPAYMGPTPAINDWVAGVVEGDATLRECGFEVLRERAAVGYTGDAFHGLAHERGVKSPQQKMLAALWRESPVSRLADGERLVTMASLLHRDRAGRSFVAALVAASGLDPATWVRRYLRAYVRPVVHCLLAHELAFMPHGENLVLVLRGGAPVRALMKDIGEEIAVMDDRPLPPDVERVRAKVPDDVKALALHTDVFDGFLRYLGAILEVDGLLPERAFWAEVGRCVREHHDDHPELAGAAAAYDLFRPEFRHSCLNRLQLRNTLQMVDLTDQAESLIYAGTLANPIAEHRRA
ncbi:GNAT family N-acetyltransferase [Nocardioides ferulae]|uniref:GNAT family N-acetyltransferase n=1 Tax=Nocardioides ferulae TaxID=2340821 RepID=UPI000EB135B8|nr:GNAT family N-acetyltransferase [Nocardioides ferulae]